MGKSIGPAIGPKIGQAAWMLLACGMGAAQAQDGWLAPERFSNTLALTSDYVYRGISYTDEKAAIQGSFDYSYRNFYAGIFGSNVHGPDYDLEIDVYVGYFDRLGPIDYDAMLVYYHYVGAADDALLPSTDLDPDTGEVWLTLSHRFTGLPLAPAPRLFYAYSPDWSYDDGDSHTVSGGLTLSLPWALTIDAVVGYQSVEGDEATGPDGAFCALDPRLCSGYSYTHTTIGVSKALPRGFSLALAYHDTDEDDALTTFYGADLVDSRVVATLARSF